MAVGRRSDLCRYLVRCRLRVQHRRRVQPTHRGLAGRVEHETQMVLDALEMARWNRGARLEGLVAHTDAGSHLTSIGYSERLDEQAAVPSIGSVGDCLLTGRGRQRALQDRTDPRSPTRTVADHRRCRASHPRLGALVQHRAHPQPPQRHLTRRLRSRLHCNNNRPQQNRKPQHSACAKPRVIHRDSSNC